MDTSVALQTRVAADQCPWCGTQISRAKFLEIEKRITHQERKKFAEERARMEVQLRAEIQKATVREKEENDKKVAALVAKLKTAEEKEVTIRKEVAAQVEAKAKAEADKKIAAMIKERDVLAAKAKDLEAARQKELERQRAALEKDRDTQLLKKHAE